jgi:hypothetical protein
MRSYAQVVPTFWTRGSGKKLRVNRDAQVLAMYLMTAPSSNLIGLYYIPLITICHETGLTESEVRATMPVIAEIARYDFDQEIAWLPEAARYQLGENMAEKDKRRAAVEREVAMVSGHQFAREFMARYGAKYGLRIDLKTEGLPESEEAPSKGHPSDGMPPFPAPAPAPAPDRQSGTLPVARAATPIGQTTDPRDKPALRVFDNGTDDDLWAFQQWAEGFGKTGATFDSRRAECLSERRREGMTREDVSFVIAGAKLDDFVMGRGKHQGNKNNRLSYIFGTRERVEEFAERGRAAAAKGSPVAAQAARQNLAELEARARRQNQLPARQAPIVPPANANRGTRATDGADDRPEPPAVSGGAA